MESSLSSDRVIGFGQGYGHANLNHQTFPLVLVRLGGIRFMARPLAKSPFVLLALGLWILACTASLAEDDDPNALNHQVNQLIEQGKYQEAIPIAERALEVAKRARGPEHPETANALDNLGLLFKNIGGYAKAEPLYQE